MTLGSLFKTTLDNTVLKEAALIKDYASNFESLWTSHPDGIPEILAQAKGKPLIIVWDGSVNSAGADRERNDNLLAPHLTPLDWALAFSIRVLADHNAVANNPKLSIHIVDLTGRAHDEWAMGMRFQLQAQMPWVTLHAPLLVDGTIDHDGYRQGYRPISGGKGLFDEPGTSQPWRLPAGSKTLVDGKGRHNDLCKLAKQWAAVLTQSDDHHDLNNAIGAYVLDGMMNPDGNAGAAGGTFLRAMLQRLSWCELIGGQQKVKYPAPKPPKKASLNVLVVDDQLQNGWDRVVLWLVGAQPPAGDAIPLNVTSLMEISAPATDSQKVYAALSANPLIDRLEKANFARRDYDFGYLENSPNTPEAIILDLRLATALDADSQQRQRADILRLVAIAKQIPNQPLSLAWPAIDADELEKIKEWCAHGRGTDRDEVNALTLLPRLLALATPLTPVILFSSTARADIKAKLQPYRNLLVAFEKPRSLSQPQSVAASLNAFREQFLQCFAFAIIRRALTWLSKQSDDVRNGRHEAQFKGGPSAISKDITRIELFFDESGDPQKQEDSLIGAFILFHSGVAQAEELNTGLINAAIKAQQKAWGGDPSAVAPIWIKFNNNYGVSRLEKYSTLLEKAPGRHQGARHTAVLGQLPGLIASHLETPLESHTESSGFRFYVTKRRGFKGPEANDLTAVRYQDNYWDRMVRLHLESLLYVVLPWIFSTTGKKLEVAVYFDQRQIEVNDVAKMRRDWGLEPRETDPLPANNMVLTVDRNTTWPLMRETILRWECSSVANKLKLDVVAGRAVGLGSAGTFTHRTPEHAGPRMIHWLADWVASAERGASKAQVSESTFASILPHGFRLVYNDDAEKLLEAARLVAHLRYAEGLAVATATALVQKQFNIGEANSVIPFLAATISDGMAQARGEDLYKAVIRLPEWEVDKSAVSLWPPAIGGVTAPPTSAQIDALPPAPVTKAVIAPPAPPHAEDDLTYWDIHCDAPFEILRVKGRSSCKARDLWYLLANRDDTVIAVTPCGAASEGQDGSTDGRFMKVRHGNYRLADFEEQPNAAVVGTYVVCEFDDWIGEIDRPDDDEDNSAPAAGAATIDSQRTPHTDISAGGSTSTPTIVSAKICSVQGSRGWVVVGNNNQRYFLPQTTPPRILYRNEEVRIVVTDSEVLFLSGVLLVANFASD